mmetsp:Transcript_110641/g.356956  ORF Transcript_110641/g.356956 Transcript_110641/m.356956 type:complete len:204 (+) Transcript_110641:924-1535(+)
MGVEVLVAVEAAGARAHDRRADERAHAARHVDDATAREVHETRGVNLVVRAARQPAVAPSPVHDHRIDPGSHDDGEDQVTRELHTLRHAAADNGGRSRAESPLEKPSKHSVGGCEVAVFVHLGEARAEGLSVVCEGFILTRADAIGQCPADGPPTQGADANVHQVLHQDVLHIFRTAAPCFHHCEAGLHEHHHGSAQDQPRVV